MSSGVDAVISALGTTQMLTASPRSVRVLQEAQQKNQRQARWIGRALDYINSNPEPLSGSDLSSLAERVAKVIKIGKWVGNGRPRFNAAGDKALIDFTFQTAMDSLGYTATFHKRDGSWILRGVRETYQAFAPAPPVPQQ